MKKNNVWKIVMVVFIPLALIAQNWVYRYNGSGNDWDEAFSIIYGADGNIYAAGLSYDSSTYMDFTVISITTAGDTNWVYRYDSGSANSWDIARSIVYGADGNIYAAGFSTAGRAFTVISLTTAGDTNWVYRYNGPGSSWDEAYSIVYGADGNLYAAGYSSGNGTLWDFTVISLTTAGDTNWVYRYNGPGNDADSALSIVYGADGNLYVAGYSRSSDTESDFTVISLTTAGDTNWVYRYNGSTNGWNGARSIVYGADGNLYAAGYSDGSGTARDFIVISLTTAGDTNWVYTYNGPGSSWDEAYSIVYGADGNLYAAGYSNGNGTARDFTVISLTTAGDTNWVYRYNGSGNSNDEANSILYGTDGNIYAAGFSYGSGFIRDFTVISLTTAGNTNWVYRYDGPGDYWDEANSIVYGADGNIYAAGYSTGIGTDYDFTVISLPSDYGVQEEKVTVPKKHKYGSTIISGPLLLPKGKNCKVFNITGRVVMPDNIKPGIYFIEIDGKLSKKVIKVK